LVQEACCGGWWLHVTNGQTGRALNVQKTKRRSSSCHPLALGGSSNSRALAAAGIMHEPPIIWAAGGRDASGNPSGILERRAGKWRRSRSRATAADDVKRRASAGRVSQNKAHQVVGRDLAATDGARSLATVCGRRRKGWKVTARAHFAVLFTPPEGPGSQAGAFFAMVKALAQRFDQGRDRTCAAAHGAAT